MSRSRALGLSLALSVTLTGCAKRGEAPAAETSLNARDARAEVQPRASPTSSTWETSPAPPAFSEGPPRRTTKAPEAGAKAEPLSDDQIVVVSATLSEAEIEQAKLAQIKAKNARVKEFAAKVMSQHTKAKVDAETLAKRHELTVASSAANAKLKEKGSEQLAKLAQVKDEDFDRTYTEAQIRQYREALKLLNTQLIPNATPDVKAQLKEQRSMLEKQLKDAQEVQGSLANKP